MANLRERLAKQKEDLKKMGPGKFFKIKEGKVRFRVLPVGEEKEWGIEITYFFLGMKSNYDVISPATIGKRCALKEGYDELSASKNASDRDFASKKLKPHKKFMVPVIMYKSDKGGELDT